MQYYKYDNDGYYLEPVIADSDEDNLMPDDVTNVPPPQPMYKAQYDGEKWIETKPRPTPPEGMIARWDGMICDWIIEDELEPPVTLDVFLSLLAEYFITA